MATLNTCLMSWNSLYLFLLKFGSVCVPLLSSLVYYIAGDWRNLEWKVRRRPHSSTRSHPRNIRRFSSRILHSRTTLPSPKTVLIFVQSDRTVLGVSKEQALSARLPYPTTLPNSGMHSKADYISVVMSVQILSVIFVGYYSENNAIAVIKHTQSPSEIREAQIDVGLQHVCQGSSPRAWKGLHARVPELRHPRYHFHTRSSSYERQVCNLVDQCSFPNGLISVQRPFFSGFYRNKDGHFISYCLDLLTKLCRRAVDICIPVDFCHPTAHFKQ